MLNIKGIGIDIFEKKRMKAALSKSTSGIFLKRVFHSTELEGIKRLSGQYVHFSKAFALKEAVLKAFGRSWNAYANFCDVRVGFKGKDIKISLFGKTKQFAGKRGVKKLVCDYSVSHRHVVAVAVLVS